MPWVEDNPNLVRGVTGRAPAPPVVGDPFGAAFRQENSVVSILQGLRNSGPFEYDPSHNPFDAIRGTPYYDNHLSRFTGSRSAGETDAIKRQIDQEEGDRRLIEASGVSGVIASLMAGAIDPTMGLPSGVAVKGVKDGIAFGKAAVRTGAAAAVQQATQETMLQATQETRSLSESALNVGSAAILGGLIGGAATSLLAREGRFNAAVEALDRDRQTMDTHAGNPPVPLPPGSLREPEVHPGPSTNIELIRQSEALKAEVARLRKDANEALDRGDRSAADVLFDQADAARAKMQEVDAEILQPSASAGGTAAAPAGAAATDVRQLELFPTGVGLEKVRINPMARMLNSPSLATRRAAADLAESPLRFSEGAEGVTPVLGGGPALDRLVRLTQNQTKVAVGDELDRLWTDLRFNGDKAPWFARARDRLGMLANDEALPNFEQFKSMVSEAMINGDRHDIPQVQQAAQFVRAKVFEPWKQRAIQAGLLPEDVGVVTADSYFQRVYNKQVIAARRPEFVNIVTDWLKSDQRAKLDAQGRLQAYRGGLDVAEQQSKKLALQIETRQAALAELEAQAEEITRVNKQAFQRSTALRESEFENIGGVR